jgi:hypothetical protein
MRWCSGAIDLHGLLARDGQMSAQPAVQVISHLAAALQEPKHHSRSVAAGCA